MCVLGLNLHFAIKRIIFRLKIKKNDIFGAMDNFKWASKQNEWYDASLKFKQSKHQF